MTGIFWSLYLFYNKNRGLLVLTVILMVGLIGSLAYQLEYEENISKMIPSDPELDQINTAVQNTKFTEKLVFNITLDGAKSEGEPDPDLLISYADQLFDSLQNPEFEGLISDITYKISDELVYEVYNSLYENLPLFLTKSDYDRIENMLSDESIENLLQGSYQTLISPASFALKKFIVRDPLGITNLAIDKLQKLQFQEEYQLFKGSVFTADRRNLLLFITPTNPANETAKNASLIEGLDQAIVSLSSGFPEVKAEYLGAAAIAVANAQQIKKDVTLTVSIALIILIALTLLVFRRIMVFFTIFLPVLLGGGCALAALYIFKSEVSLISLGIGSVLLGITIDYSLHIYTHYRSTGSVKMVYKDLPHPIFISCFTTASAFICLMFLHSEAMRDLGLFASVAVVSAAFFALLLLPHFLKSKKENGHRFKTTFLDKISGYAYDENKWLVLSIFLLSMVFIFSSKEVKFQSDLSGLYYMPEKLAEAEKNLDKINDYSLKSIYLIASGKTLDEALENNEQSLAKLDSLETTGVIRKYATVSYLMFSQKAQQRQIDRWENFWTPDKKENLKSKLIEIGATYKFRENAFQNFFDILDKDFQPIDASEFGEIKGFLNDYISEKEDITTISSVIRIEEGEKDTIYDTFAGIPNLVTFDRQLITNRFISLLEEDFNLLVKLSLGAVFLLLMMAFGRMELAFITFTPMLLSWLFTLGIMGLIGIEFNIFNIIITTFVFGLGIDYSIFITRGLLQEYKEGFESLPSFKTSILLSSITTLTGVGVLVIAKHPALQSIAILSVIGISAVILISFTVTPLLFRFVSRSSGGKKKYPMTIAGFLQTSFAYGYFVLGCVVMTILTYTVFSILPAKNKRVQMVFQKLLMMHGKSVLYVMTNLKKTVVNEYGEDFSKPAIIIGNHQSFIDILVMLMITPKRILITNDWVYNSPIFGKVVKKAGFYPASKGYENGLEELENKVKEGYSIIIFPEGTRSATGKIGRFHKGAFFLAEKLQLDILPILLHGTGDCITKGEFLLKNGHVTIKILERIKHDDQTFGITYQEKTKNISRYFKDKFASLKAKCESPAYFRHHLIANYLYKGPVLEWYLKVKIRLEGNYELFDQHLPKKGKIVDIGCGYGFLPYMLAFTSPEREITGIDHDEFKIATANNCYAKNEKLNFICGDISTMEFAQSDAFVISDVLHYLTEDDQKDLIERCMAKLNPGGVILIRDGDKSMEKRHSGTKLTEFFSTKLLKFNKMKYGKLFFISKDHIINTVENYGLKAEIIDNTKFTSNLVFVISKEG